MRPPQARPTDQAVSSATPKRNNLGPAPFRTACASSATAPSTQPPLTEPLSAPSAAMAILAPGRRGAEPQVDTTVASASFVPLARQRSMSPITSRTHPDYTTSRRDCSAPRLLCFIDGLNRLRHIAAIERVVFRGEGSAERVARGDVVEPGEGARRGSAHAAVLIRQQLAQT